jgi:uncharacterized protein (DUF362 family)
MTALLLSERAAEVGIAFGPKRYDARAPFSPERGWPETAWLTGRSDRGSNGAYATIRESFRLLGLDAARYGTAHWNPLAGVVCPGDTVVVKPNFVRDFRESSRDDAECLLTHGSVIRAVVDYVYLALEGRGRIVVADAPHNDADFDGIRRITSIDAIVAFYRDVVGFPLEVYDLRPEAAMKIDGVIVGHRPLAGDPAGYVAIDLGPDSAFEEIGDRCRLLYGSEYDRSELVTHHSDGRHEYLISRTVLTADCVISVPKMKTHKKTGLTVNLKNLVGINGNKNWLPHHREGTPAQGGDQFAGSGLLQRSEQTLVSAFKRGFPALGPLRPFVARPLKSFGKAVFGDTNAGTIRSGNWHGNDTTWRMALDLNRVLFYADASGGVHRRPVRRFFSIVDGIVAGEGNGPLDPEPRAAGVILCGHNPVAVDAVAARLMGFDLQKLPIVSRAADPCRLPLTGFALDSVCGRSNVAAFDGLLATVRGRALAFKPHFGWKGHIEVSETDDEASVFA